MENQSSYVALGLKVWKAQIERADKLFGGLFTRIVDANPESLPRGSFVTIRGQPQTMRSSYLGLLGRPARAISSSGPRLAHVSSVIRWRRLSTVPQSPPLSSRSSYFRNSTINVFRQLRAPQRQGTRRNFMEYL